MAPMNPELYKAATSGKTDLFSINEVYGSDFFLQKTLEKNSALHLAVKCNRKEFTEKIIGLHQELLYHANSKGDTPLHIAARVGRLEMTILLTSCSKNVESQEVEAHKKLLRMVNLEKDTVLHDAVRNGHFEIVELLLRADPELTSFVNANKESPLFLAVDRKHFRIASLIFEVAPTDCPYGGRNKMNVLHAAIIRTSNIRQFNTFIDGWALYVDNPLYNLLYHLLPVVKKAWTKVNDMLAGGITGGRRITPTVFVLFADKHLLSFFYHQVFMSPFIGRYPDAVAEADDHGWTPLHYSAYLRHTKAVKVLLMDNNKHVAYMKDKQGMSALHIAAKEGHENVMKMLITSCPEICELRDDKGRTALHVAVESGKASAVKYALKTPNFEGLINEQDKKGNTLLHLAAIHGHFNIAKMLANDNRIDKGAMNRDGFTAIELMSKVELRRFEKASITKKLVQAGALPSLEGVVIREKTETENVETKEQSQQTERKEEPVEDREINHIALDRNGESIAGMKAKSLSLDRKGDPTESKDLKYQSLKDIASGHFLVATIIATVTFAAGFTMPGGYESQEPNQGMAILSRKLAFKSFLIADTVAFCCSAASMLMHYWASMHTNYNVVLHFMRFASSLTYYSIFGMVTAFISGTNVVLAGSPELAITNLAIGCCFLMVFCIWFFG